LAVKVPKLAQSIIDALKEEPALVADAAPCVQFAKLVEGPLKATAEQLALPIIVVMDALDECTTPADILSSIRAELRALPPLFKILITSRPIPGIRSELDAIGDLVRQIGLNHDANVDRDIDAFLRDQMSRVARDYELENWPGEGRLQALVEKAAGLFIWASTAVKNHGRC
jgi:hypothetical protein